MVISIVIQVNVEDFRDFTLIRCNKHTFHSISPCFSLSLAFMLFSARSSCHQRTFTDKSSDLRYRFDDIDCISIDNKNSIVIDINWICCFLLFVFSFYWHFLSSNKWFNVNDRKCVLTWSSNCRKQMCPILCGEREDTM